MSVLNKQLVVELENRDARRRKKAIETLGTMQEPNAIKLLLAVSRQDPDEKLREMALNLARTRDAEMTEKLIAEKKQSANKALNANAQEAKKRAKAATEEAFGLHTSGNDVNALRCLSKALTIYPDIRHDGYFMNIVQAITGEDGEAALQLLPKPTKSFWQNMFSK